MGQSSNTSGLNRVAFIGNYLPRQCGIATFTTDLCEAFAAEYYKTTCIAVPVNDTAAGYPYPSRVRFELTEQDIDSYRRAADFLNINNVDLVCLQHEYGIFGGRAGSHILALLREVRMPIVTTLHTILREPDPDQRRVLEEVAGLSDRVVVMSQRGVEFLHEIYGVPRDKIDVIQHDGETYRLSLQRLAQEKGVEGQVIFYNRFVSLEELVEFIGAADIYITPYLNAAQITSGTLAYTVGAGKAVISTPYWYAEEMLAEERGVLVPFADPAALAEQVIALLDNESDRHAMRKRAYLFGRDMIWPQVARRYRESFDRARAERRHFDFTVKPLDKRPEELPSLKLDHLHNMTDTTGMLQHALFTVPNYSEGYTTDDNARALMVGALLEELGNRDASALASRYLAFISYAFNPETGRFRNFMDYQHNWLEASGSDGSHGRALWALGTVLGRSNTAALQSMAGRLFEQALPKILKTTSPRAWAFALIGIHEYLRRFEGDRRADLVRQQLAGRLLELYQTNNSEKWHWFEDRLAYCNAALPHAMLLCGQWIPNDAMAAAGMESLTWLTDVQRAKKGGHFVPIGSNGFYRKGGKRARFDQQPVEAQATVSACLEAQRITGDTRWRKEAGRAFDWFSGRNDLNLPVYDPTTGGCRDGLHPDRANENQGAESTLAYLHALLELRLAEHALQSVETKSK